MLSRAIQLCRYDASQRALRFVFTSGRRYVYAEVPAEIATALDAAEAKAHSSTPKSAIDGRRTARVQT